MGVYDVVVLIDKVKMVEYVLKVDFIIDMVLVKYDVNEYLNLFVIDGSVVLVGLLLELLEIGVFNIVMGCWSFFGLNIGGIVEI